ERLSIRSRAACFRRNQLHSGKRPAIELLRADGKRLQRPVHGGVAKTTTRGQPLAQPDNARKCVHHPEATRPARRSHQQSAIIGAEVQRGIKLFGRFAQCIARRGRLIPPYPRFTRTGGAVVRLGRARLALRPFRRCSALARRITTPHKDAITAALSLALPSAFYRLVTRIGRDRIWPGSYRRQTSPGGGVIANTFRDRWRVTSIVVHRDSFHAERPSCDVRRFISCCP